MFWGFRAFTLVLLYDHFETNYLRAQSLLYVTYFYIGMS